MQTDAESELEGAQKKHVSLGIATTEAETGGCCTKLETEILRTYYSSAKFDHIHLV